VPGTPPPDFVGAAVVPELTVTELAASLRFWCGLCGFEVLYDRPEEGFAYLRQGAAQVMLEEAGAPGRRWVTASPERPFGRGMNLQIEVAALDPILVALQGAGWPLYLAPETKWYRAGAVAFGQRQFLVQDPDGYLLRFCSGVGTRPAG